MIIAIDFDGTIVTHEFPEIGKPVPGAIEVMKNLQNQGHKLILYTMRSDIEDPHSDYGQDIFPEGGEYLTEALDYCKNNGIEFWGVNENPEQHSWTHSPKAYAQIYIDDATLGCPLVYPKIGKPYVDWLKVEKQLFEQYAFLPF